jgi:hypothetical protein
MIFLKPLSSVIIESVDFTPPGFLGSYAGPVHFPDPGDAFPQSPFDELFVDQRFYAKYTAIGPFH